MGCTESNIITSKDSVKFTVDNQFNVYGKIVADDDVSLKKYIDSGYLINYKMRAFSRRTALHIAAEHGSVKCTKLLLALKADVNSKDYFNITPLMLATGSESKEIT